MSDVIVGALVGAAASLLGVLAMHRFTLTRDRVAAAEKRQGLLWERRLEAVLEIERNAGLLIDRLTNYRPLDQYDPNPSEIYRALENQKGLIYRYDSLWRALNEFNHQASLVISRWNRWDDRQERDQVVADLDIAFGKLVAAVDELKSGGPVANAV